MRVRCCATHLVEERLESQGQEVTFQRSTMNERENQCEILVFQNSKLTHILFQFATSFKGKKVRKRERQYFFCPHITSWISPSGMQHSQIA